MVTEKDIEKMHKNKFLNDKYYKLRGLITQLCCENVFELDIISDEIYDMISDVVKYREDTRN